MIKGTVIGQHLTVSAPHVAGETIAKLTADFDFTPEWNGLTAIAYFSDGENTHPFLLTDEGKITEEQNLNLAEGKWECFVWGFDLTGIDTFDIDELPQNAVPRLTTNVASFKVHRTGIPGADPVEVVPASLGEQILAVAKDAKTTAEDVKRRADTGDLKGKDGYTPIKGIDYFDGEKGEKGEKGDPGTYELTDEDKQQIADDVRKDLPENNVVIMDYADVTYAAAKAAVDEGKTVIVRTQPRKPTWVWDHDDEAMVVFSENLYLTMAGITFTHIVFSGVGKFGSDTFALMLTISASDEKTARAVLLKTVTEDIVADWGFTKNAGTYDKPVNGIPESDLSADVRIKLNDRGGSDVTAETVKEWGFAEEADLAAVAKSGSYNDLSNKPSIPAAVTESTVSGWGFTKFDGSYSSLSGKPTIPTKLSALTGDSTHRVVTDVEKAAWNAKSDFNGDYNSLSNKPTIPEPVTDQHIIDVVNAAYPAAEGVGF